MFCIKCLARPDRWIQGSSCSLAPAPSVPLGSAVEMPLWSPVIPTAKAERQAPQGCDLHHSARPGEDELASSSVPPSVSAAALK